MTVPAVHHIWCNGQQGPVEGCWWCDPDGTGTKGLWAKYPYSDAKTAHELAARFFPDAVPVSPDVELDVKSSGDSGNG